MERNSRCPTSHSPNATESIESLSQNFQLGTVTDVRRGGRGYGFKTEKRVKRFTHAHFASGTDPHRRASTGARETFSEEHIRHPEPSAGTSTQGRRLTTPRHSHDDTRPTTRHTAHIGHWHSHVPHATTPTQALPQRTQVKATPEAIIQLYPLHQLKPPPPVGGANALENWPLRAFGPPPAWVGGSTSIGASPCAFCADVIQSRGWRNPPPPPGLLAFEAFWTNDGCGCRGESADGCWRTAAPPLSSGSKRAGCPSRVTHCRFSWS